MSDERMQLYNKCAIQRRTPGLDQGKYLTWAEHSKLSAAPDIYRQ